MVQEKRDRDRHDRIEDAIQAAVAEGWVIEGRSDFQALLVRGKPVNHILHLLLCFPTLGFWLFVWLLLVLVGGEKRQVITVDRSGAVTRRDR